MKNRDSIREIIDAFCRTWFEQRDAEGALRFLTEDVDFVGTGKDEFAQGKERMLAYLRQDMMEIPEPFACSCSVVHEQPIAERVCNLSIDMTLKNSLYTWHLRGFFTVIGEESGGWLIKSFHFAEPGGSQRGSEHYPQTLVVESIQKQQQELLSDSVLGGMMGGYIEEGFPFYFVNRQMLAYLGYENEAQFIADIHGMIANCMHPDDREAVDAAVAAQLEEKDEYTVEYRMKKKDGSYIWVHDLGRRLTAENGKPAIASVCIDITALKEAQEEILNLYNNIPGAVFRCRLDDAFSVIDANDGLFDFLGYTREEFAAMGNSMATVTYPEDVSDIRKKMAAQLQAGNTFHFEKRLLCKNGIVKWISLKGQLLTEKNGERYLYCVFVDITEEKQLRKRVRELYDNELAYFVELSSVEGSIQGRINLTQNRMENYLSSDEVSIATVGGCRNSF